MPTVAIYDDATLVINAGNYFINPTVGSLKPVDLLDPEGDVATPGWTNVGHTSLEDILAVASEGGEATVIGTLQNKSLRTKYSARTESLAFTLQQFDVASLKLYYGSNATIAAGGDVEVPTDPIPTTASFLAVFVDGLNVFAFYAPKAEIFRADDLALSDTESLAGLPLSIKPMINGTNTYAYAVTPLAVV